MVPCGELVWWRQGGSNPQPRHCERRALPIELCPHDEPIKVKTSRRLMSNRMAARRLMSSCRRPPIRVITFGRRDSVSAQGIEYSYPGRADVKWMRILSGKKGTEFSPRVPIDSQIFPFCPEIRVISYLRHCGGTRFFKFGPIVSHSCFSWRLGRPCLCGCRMTPAGGSEAGTGIENYL